MKLEEQEKIAVDEGLRIFHKNRFSIVPNKAHEIGLTPYEFIVYARILYRGTCFEKQAKMAEACRMSRRQLNRCIQELHRRRLIDVEDRIGADGLRKSSVIRTLNEAEWVVETERHNGDTETTSLTDTETTSLNSNKTPSSSLTRSEYTTYILTTDSQFSLDSNLTELEPLEVEVIEDFMQAEVPVVASKKKPGKPIKAPKAPKPGKAPKPKPQRKLIAELTDEEILAGEHQLKVDIPDEILELAMEWKEYTDREVPHLASKIKNYGAALMSISRSTDLNATGLKALFDFIIHDEFWKHQCYSPHGLLKLSKNGLRKIDNILVRMKNDRGAKMRKLNEELKDFKVDF